jgi:hypothetical protein
MDNKHQKPKAPAVHFMTERLDVHQPMRSNPTAHQPVFKGTIIPLPAAAKHINQRYSFDCNGGNYQGL